MTGKFDSLAYFISVVNVNVPDVRGASVVSRLANVAPERIHAYAFLALSYILPDPEWDYEKTLERNKELVGRKLFGYWAFFSREDGAKKIEDNVGRGS